MKIGLIDVDGHDYPSLPLMKLSAWHKQRGDSVEWYEPLLSGHMDRVYMSKVFSFTPDYEYFIDADEIFGGVQDMLYHWILTVKRSMTKLKIKDCLMKLNTPILTTAYILN